MKDPALGTAKPHVAALAEARLLARQCLSALRSVDARDVSGEIYLGIERTAAQLREVVQELERVERAVARGR